MKINPVAVLTIFSLLAIGCASEPETNKSPDATVDAPETGTIRIGWLGPLTGDGALWGQDELNAINMVFDEINARGGIDVGIQRYKLEVVAGDDKGDYSESVTVVKRLINVEKVTAILGPGGSGEAIPAAPLVNYAKVPLIATTATNPRVTVAEDGSVHPFMFRVCFNDPYQGKAAAYFAYEKLGKRNAAIFMTIDDAYSVGLAQYFKEAFVKLGGRIVAEASFTYGEREFQPALRAIKKANPDIIFSPNYYDDVALSARQARELGINAPMLGGDAWPSENLVALAGTALEGCFYLSHFYYDGPDAKPFRDAYEAIYQIKPELGAYIVHDAIMMLTDAIQRAGSLDGEAIAKALETCDIQGITGHIKVGPNHDPENKDIFIFKIKGPDMVFQEKYAPQ